MPFEEFPARFGSYILLDQIASGGMAEVYRGKTTGAEGFQRLLAIKCIKAELCQNPQFEPMFIDEANMAANLSHANIVQIYELGRVREQLYIAMELVNGRDLKKIIKLCRATQTSVPLSFAVYVANKTAEALDFAHNMKSVDGEPLNIVHRDVSPQNILVSYDGQVKVVDFGIARADQRITQTQVGVIKGKFAYMAPEQTVSEEMDRRVDVFALGATTFELLTGRQLFGAKDRIKVLENVRRAEVPSLREWHPDYPEELDEVLGRALAKDPADRFQSAAEFAEALSPMLIHDNTIVGARQAARVMKGLFRDEIREAGERLKDYMDVTLEDCIGGDYDTGTTVLGAATSEVAATRIKELDRTAWQTPELEDSNPSAPEIPRPGYREAETLLLAPQQVVAARASLPETDKNQTIPVRRPDEWYPSQDAAPESRFPVLAAVVALLVLALAGVWVFLELKGRDSVTVVETVVREVEMSGQTPEPAPPTATVSAPVPTPQPAAPDPPASPEPLEQAGAPVETPTPHEPRQPTKGDDRDKGNRARFGFVSVKAEGVPVAKVMIDGREVGYSPIVARRVRSGSRRIKVVEMNDGEPGRAKTRVVKVTPGHTRLAPLKIIMAL